MDEEAEVQPLVVAPAPLVEDTDTKSIRVPVVHPPLPEPVAAPRVEASELVIPKRPRFYRRVLLLPPVRHRRSRAQ